RCSSRRSWPSGSRTRCRSWWCRRTEGTSSPATSSGARWARRRRRRARRRRPRGWPRARRRTAGSPLAARASNVPARPRHSSRSGRMLSSPMLRRALAALSAREHDVVVVGGGIHGAAAAWEAASRNLSVALLEGQDFGGGTSWNSLKTIHGGMRHLQRLDLAGLRESARERRALLTVAPELVRPLA